MSGRPFIASQRVRLPPGKGVVRQPKASCCCTVYGNVHREAYAAGGEATHIEPRSPQCWCPLCQNGEGHTGSAAKDSASASSAADLPTSYP